MTNRSLCALWTDDGGQDVAEYALMLTLILVLVIATIQSIGTNADAIFNKTSAALN
jgi:Flp pilus assembly pilin Flp